MRKHKVNGFSYPLFLYAARLTSFLGFNLTYTICRTKDPCPFSFINCLKFTALLAQQTVVIAASLP